MKTLTIILIVLVSLALVFSLASFIIIITGNSGNIHINFNHPAVTSHPTATQAPIPDSVAINYNETSKEAIDNNTKIVFTINATYISGNSSTLDYSKFTLDLYVPRGGFLPPPLNIQYIIASVAPQETGIAEVGKSDKTVIFQLSFEFPTYVPNYPNNTPYSSYTLDYTQAPFQIQWSRQ